MEENKQQPIEIQYAVPEGEDIHVRQGEPIETGEVSEATKRWQERLAVGSLAAGSATSGEELPDEAQVQDTGARTYDGTTPGYENFGGWGGGGRSPASDRRPSQLGGRNESADRGHHPPSRPPN